MSNRKLSEQHTRDASVDGLHFRMLQATVCDPGKAPFMGGLGMFRLALGLTGILTLVLLLPYSSNAQQAEAPVYKDGDWWRVKVHVVRPAGVSVSGPVLERFPEYIVKFESNKPKVFGVRKRQCRSRPTSGHSTGSW